MKRAVRPALRPRAGIAVMLVMGLLAVTLTVAYAVLRYESTVTIVQVNQNQLDNARLAAMSGISAALRAIHTSNWTGVGTQVSATLGNGTSYTVQFLSGDDQLTSSSPDYGMFPYRVTLHSVGSAAPPDNPSAASTYTIDVVVQLIPTNMQSLPTQWNRVQGYTLYQWDNQSAAYNLPAQVVGKAHCEGFMSFAPSYPVDGVPRAFQGNIDEVAIYNRALTPTDILAIYNATVGSNPITLYTSYGPSAHWPLNEGADAVTAADQVGGHHGTYVGAKAGRADVPFANSSSSAFFDGINDHIECGSFDTIGSGFTVLAWIRPTSLSGDVRIVSKAMGESDDEQCWKLSVEQVLTDYRVTFGAMVGGQYREAQANIGTVPLNSWTFVAGVQNGAQILVYKNGLLERTIGANGLLATNTNAFVVIGDAPPGSPRTRLLRGYYDMYQNGAGDYRPLTTSWEAPSNSMSSETRNLLEDDLRVTMQSVTPLVTPPATLPVTNSTYRLFTGGPVYTIPTIPSVLRNITLKADPATNPLGIFRCNSSLTIRDAVNIQGTILVTDGSFSDLLIDDDNVSWTPVDLQKLPGEASPRQLPIALVPDDFQITEGCRSVSLRGQVVVGDLLQLTQSDELTDVSLLGSCVCKQLDIRGDARWPTQAANWKSLLQTFLQQRLNITGIRYFPQWLEATQGLQISPRLRLAPDDPGRIYHWPNFSQPLYQAAPNDQSLRWKLIAWRDKG